jgi:hypothetical protein
VLDSPRAAHQTPEIAHQALLFLLSASREIVASAVELFDPVVRFIGDNYLHQQSTLLLATYSIKEIVESFDTFQIVETYQFLVDKLVNFAPPIDSDQMAMQFLIQGVFAYALRLANV